MNDTEEGPSGNGLIIMTPCMIQMLGVLITGSETGLLEPFVRTLEAGNQDPDLNRSGIRKYVEEIASAGAGRDPDLADDLLEKASKLADGGRFAEAGGRRRGDRHGSRLCRRAQHHGDVPSKDGQVRGGAGERRQGAGDEAGQPRQPRSQGHAP